MPYTSRYPYTPHNDGNNKILMTVRANNGPDSEILLIATAREMKALH